MNPVESSEAAGWWNTQRPLTHPSATRACVGNASVERTESSIYAALRSKTQATRLREHNQPDSIDTTPAATGTPQSEGPTVTQPATTQELIADVLIHHMNDDDAYTAADAVMRDPAITIRRRVVISGEWRDVRDALDTLPEGSQIRWRANGRRALPILGIKITNTMGHASWSTTGLGILKAETIARDNTPIEVIA